MTTRFNVRKKVLGNLKPVRLAANSAEPVSRSRGTEVPPPETIEPIVIDTRMRGESEIMAAHLLPGKRPALIDPGPANTAGNVIKGLREVGIQRLDSIVLTHVHCENAGAAGESVTGYLVNPERLADSARAIWGEDAEKWFGRSVAVETTRLRPLRDGDSVDLGDRRLEAIASPGHTGAHMVFFDRQTGAMVCGDALGLQLPGSRTIRPSTPPSDFCHDEAVASIEKLRGFDPASLHFAHYGESRQSPGETFDRAITAMTAWRTSFLKKSEVTENGEELLRSVNACVEATLEPVPPSVRRRFEVANPTWVNIAGMSGDLDRKQSRLADAA
jgi:glyoxylase-like metal-dependent hydrolase (beta-lactamase superfamily II)